MMPSLGLGSLIIGIVGAIFGAILSYLGVLHKAKNTESQIVLQAWKELVEPLKAELINTKEEVIKLRAALEAAELLHQKETGRLMKRIRELEQVNRDRA